MGRSLSGRGKSGAGTEGREAGRQRLRFRGSVEAGFFFFGPGASPRWAVRSAWICGGRDGGAFTLRASSPPHPSRDALAFTPRGARRFVRRLAPPRSADPRTAPGVAPSPGPGFPPSRSGKTKGEGKGWGRKGPAEFEGLPAEGSLQLWACSFLAIVAEAGKGMPGAQWIPALEGTARSRSDGLEFRGSGSRPDGTGLAKVEFKRNDDLERWTVGLLGESDRRWGSFRGRRFRCRSDEPPRLAGYLFDARSASPG
jgi:hypothetical protein